MNDKSRLLVVEDEAAIRAGLVDVFVFHGFEVDVAETGNEGLKKSLSGQYDLILLDVMLPGINGFEILEQVRQEDREQAIIMLTAKGTDDDVIQGLTLGADDYVSKPFSITQLVLRVQAVLRRTQPIQGDGMITLDTNYHIDTRNLQSQCGEELENFTRREMDILEHLHQHHDRPVSREELLTKVWGYDRNLDLETRTVDIHIAKLRKKLEPEPSQPKYLVTIRGAGYKLLSQ